MFSLRNYVQEHMSEYSRYYGNTILVYINNRGRIAKRVCKDEAEALRCLPRNTLFDKILDYEIITISPKSLRIKHRRKIR